MTDPVGNVVGSLFCLLGLGGTSSAPVSGTFVSSDPASASSSSSPRVSLDRAIAQSGQGSVISGTSDLECVSSAVKSLSGVRVRFLFLCLETDLIGLVSLIVIALTTFEGLTLFRGVLRSRYKSTRGPPRFGTSHGTAYGGGEARSVDFDKVLLGIWSRFFG